MLPLWSEGARVSGKNHGPSATRRCSLEPTTVDATTMDAAADYTTAAVDDGTTQPVDAATTIPRSATTILRSVDAATPSDIGYTT